MTKLVCVGGSTGAPAGLTNLLQDLPEGFPCPVLVALHMPAAMTASYARTLEGKTPFRVLVAEHDTRPEPGCVYIGPGGLHIGLGTTGRLVVTPNPANTFFKPSIDVLFFTAARAVNAGTVAVVLTGLSAKKDAVEGALAVRKRGGRVIVLEDPASKFLGMPKNVIDAGAATDVAPLTGLGKTLRAAAN